MLPLEVRGPAALVRQRRREGSMFGRGASAACVAGGRLAPAVCKCASSGGAWLHRKGSCGDSCSDGGGVNQFVFERDGINGVRRRRKKMVAVAVCGAVPTRKEMGLQHVALLPWLTACVAEWRRSSRVSLREKEGCGVAEARCKVRVVSGGRSGGRGSDDDGSCSYGERMAAGKRRRCSSRSVDEEPASCMAGWATDVVV